MAGSKQQIVAKPRYIGVNFDPALRDNKELNRLIIAIPIPAFARRSLVSSIYEKPELGIEYL
jgi:hypothetical protein